MKMRRIILILCVLAVAAAWLCWPRGERVFSPAAKSTAPASRVATAAASPVKTNQTFAAVKSGPSPALATNAFPLRLANTAKTIGQLTTAAHAILLENALVDTEAKLDLSIPKHLQAGGEPGAFIVQARSMTGAAFRAALAGAGAEIVSYIPNNAYLVRLSAAGAAKLTGNPQVQAVLPYQPYFKISSAPVTPMRAKSASWSPFQNNPPVSKLTLLGLAVKQMPLPAGMDLTLGLFAGGAPATKTAIEKLGGTIVSSDRSPFGQMVRVHPPTNWIALAQLPGVQLVEPVRERKPMNDLARMTLGITSDTVSTTNYMNLTGKNVMVEVNDTGVDINHPDFVGRVTYDNLGSVIDTDGHGTHVAGIIAGDGTKSTTVIFASGSTNPGSALQYRGKAPGANVYSVAAMPNGRIILPDSYMQEQPVKAKALISNNSWGASGAGYDLSAASYDAAVRDAVPENTGPQPVLFVFAAGNDGGGGDNGLGGNYDSVASPATAKNVITVGSLEQNRNLTNIVTRVDGTTVQPWLGMTDSGTQVASYSSRGNVGVGTEGTYGRFKPDVVAPGTWVVSTRSTALDTNAYYQPYEGPFNHNSSSEYLVSTNFDNSVSYYIPVNATAIKINAVANFFSPTPFPTLEIYVSATNPNIDPADPTTYDFISTNNTVNIPPSGGPNYLQSIIANGGTLNLLVTDYTNTIPVDYNLEATITTTNDYGNLPQVLQDLNGQLGPYYIFDTGTSMAAPAVSGTLALMQDFFTNTLHLAPSPALLKAMLINGARVTGGNIFAVNQVYNYQGWGLPQLPNSIPAALSASGGPLCFFDQSPQNVLATGDSETFIVTPGDQTQPLRITLAWTDPPGNPAAAVKLVNNLDLVVTNLTTGEIYYGNNFAANGNPPYSLASSTNAAPQFDAINNVENVFIAPSLGASYSVTVIGRNVNVNAVTTVATNIVQDFALVMALGDNSSSTLTVTAAPSAPVPSTAPPVIYLTGTLNELADQMAGANDPLSSTSTIPFGTNSGYATNAVLYIGQTNQWRFYVVTNATTFTNFAFVTFYPNTLSIPREGVFAGSDANSTLPEPNLDIYVATYPSDPDAASLTNLNPLVIFNCIYGLNGDQTALARGGTKFVAFSNSASGTIYYIGVKCENQMAGGFSLVSAISQIPFSTLDASGNQYVNGVGLPLDVTNNVPNGDNAHPSTANVLGLATYPMQVDRVVVTNTISTENYGDLYGFLNHGEVNVFLNNHDGLGSGSFTQSYDDSGLGDGKHTDGPGATLTNYMGTTAIGPWMMTQVDDNYMQLASITDYNLKIEPHQPPGTLTTIVVPPKSWTRPYYVDVPAGYTNLTIIGIDETGPPVMQMYEQLNAIPTFANYDNEVVLNQPFGAYWSNSISIGPPLAAGVYVYRFYNPDSVQHTVEQGYFLSYPPWAVTNVSFTSAAPVPLLDDAVTTDTITVADPNPVGSFNVGLRVDHPRISDLAFHLISPDGKRYLVMENRGNTDTNGCGLTVISTNLSTISPNGDWHPKTNFFNTGSIAGTFPVDYNFYTATDRMTIYYGTNAYPTNMIFDSGYTNNPTNNPPQHGGGAQDTSNELFSVIYGPTNGLTSTWLTVIMNQDETNARGTAWTYTAAGIFPNYYYLTFTEDTNLTTTPIKFAPTPFVPTTPTNLYYQAEQSLSAIAGASAYGTWQLEVLDNRAGATNPAPQLLSWQLGLSYIKAYPYLLGFNRQTNQVAGNSIVWYEVFVPTNAGFATNILVSATGPVNLWFSTNTPPTTPPGANDTLLLANSTGGIGTPVLSAGSTPPLLPGGLYFLGVQHTGGGTVTYRLEVDFDHGNPAPGPKSVVFKSVVVGAGGPQLQWAPAAGSHYQVQWKDNLTDPWNTIGNPPTTLSNGVATFSDTDPSLTAPLGKQRFYRLVWVP